MEDTRGEESTHRATPKERSDKEESSVEPTSTHAAVVCPEKPVDSSSNISGGEGNKKLASKAESVAAEPSTRTRSDNRALLSSEHQQERHENHDILATKAAATDPNQKSAATAATSSSPIKISFAPKQRQAELEADPQKKRLARREAWMKRKAKKEKWIADWDSDPEKTAKARQLWQQINGEVLEPALRSGAIALLDATWLVEYALYNSSDADDPHPRVMTLLPCRQELPPEAFLSLDQIMDSTSQMTFLASADIHVLVLSYMWLHPDHPDPKGITLQAVANHCMHRLTLVQRYPPRWGVFCDYASLYQHPNPKEGIYRTSYEQDLFKEGLNSLSALFSHPHTSCLRLLTLPTDYPHGYNLPEGANCAKYSERGWPFVETCWMQMGKTYQKVDNIVYGIDYNSVMYGKSQQKKLLHHIQPPLTPDKMWEELQHKSFTNEKDDRPLVFQLYRQNYETSFAGIRNMEYREVGWTNRDIMEVADIIESGATPRLESIDLGGNHKLGEEGWRALAHALLSAPNAPQHLESISLAGTCIGDEGVQIMASVLVKMRSLNLSRCKMGVESCRTLAEAVSCAEDSIQWTHLNLSFNKAIGSEGLMILCPILKNLDLISLDVSGTELDNHGCEALVNALLCSNDTHRLTKLTLACFYELTATDTLCEHLCKLLQMCPDMHSLRLGRLKNKYPQFKERIVCCARNADFRLILR